jgi:hypothetical protein
VCSSDLLAAGTDDTQRNLTAIGHQDLGKHAPPARTRGGPASSRSVRSD